MSKKMKKDHARVPSGASRGQTHNFLSTNLPAAILVAALLNLLIYLIIQFLLL